MNKAIINVRIYDFNQYIDNGYIVFDQEISVVGDMKDFVNHDYKIIDGRGRLALPSLVCGHAHIYSMFARGLALEFNPHNFQEILDQLWWRIDHEIDNQTSFDSGIAAGIEFLKNGVTTVIDHHASGKDIRGSLNALKRAVCDRVGLRGIFAFEVSDRFDVTQAIAENRQFIKKYHQPYTSGLFGLHASMSLSEKTLKKVKSALGESPIHIHVAESISDQEDAETKYQETVIERLDRHGLLNPDSLLVHAIHVQEKELEIIRNRDCYVALNFTSNMNNAVGLADIKALQKAGVKVILGNDGISSGMASEYQALYYATHHREQSPTALGLDDVKKMINETYAYTSRRLGVKLGAIAPSYQADLLLLPYDPPTMMDHSNAFGHLFFGLFNAFKPQEVFIGGKLVIHNYELRNKKLLDEYSRIRATANQLWENIKKRK
ncbi:MAG TPA: amidohydrolase family protein [Bacilli bacterium]|jgi:cytosine/adenosine deaminase-related metal-dependent hydrolase|nr:amidohydrolase family protein [Bacilli bacterium]MDD3389380.1 amidohydrolase family protein [Bacilli bacterium]MDD4345077.1 amidohydrolase family protein [Bacilli bacterium]MDD4521108.1 amidohydrolase family protein [Bacilli bacterium]MDY0399869.1 amidohydrolase family protein [Bacilli bacterium]